MTHGIHIRWNKTNGQFQLSAWKQLGPYEFRATAAVPAEPKPTVATLLTMEDRATEDIERMVRSATA